MTDPASMTASAAWVSGQRFLGAVGSGHGVILDASADAAGQRLGGSPMEMLLLSLAGCTGMDVAAILRKMRQPMTGCAVSVSGVRAAAHPRVFTDIHVRYRIAGIGLEVEKVKRAVALSMDNYCSVSAMLGKTARLTHEIVIVDGNDAASGDAS